LIAIEKRAWKSNPVLARGSSRLVAPPSPPVETSFEKGCARPT